MILNTHGRYHYSPISDRPYYEWPGGKGLAVYVAVNHANRDSCDTDEPQTRR